MYRDLSGQSVVIRPLDVLDLADYAMMFSPLVMQLLRVGSLDAEISYVKSCLELSDFILFYGIFYQHTLIGAIQIRHKQEHASQLYGWLNEKYWGKGFYQEALKLVARYYFIHTHNVLLRAHVDVDNKRSYYALKKCGFADFGCYNGPAGKQYVLVLRRQRL